MSKMAELHAEVEEMIEAGHELPTIATVLNIPYNWVLAVAEEMTDRPEFEDVPF